MALFGSQRDISLIRGINRELLGNIITQQASIYKPQLNKTIVNIYGESSKEKYYDGPFIFNCLIDRGNQLYSYQSEGVNYNQTLKIAFLKDDLIEANLKIDIGDIILYQEDYFSITSTIENQYFVGKNPNYPNDDNPINPGLENFGSTISIVCDAHYVPADKLGISKNKERM